MAEPAHGVMFHHFHGEPVHRPGQGSITSETFADMMEFVGRDRILAPEDWQERARAGRLRDGDLCLTFDDALRSQFDLALPVLNALDLRAFWFVYSSVFRGEGGRLEVYRHLRHNAFDSMEEYYVAFEAAAADAGFAAELRDGLQGVDTDRHLAEFPFYTPGDRRFRFIRDRILGPHRYFNVMDRMVAAAGYHRDGLARVLWFGDDELRYLCASGHVVGLHSYTHPTDMAGLSRTEQEREYRANVEHLTAALGVPPTTMSHPTNSYTADTLGILDALGIEMGFRANMVGVADAGPLELPREDHANILALMTGGAA